MQFTLAHAMWWTHRQAEQSWMPTGSCRRGTTVWIARAGPPLPRGRAQLWPKGWINSDCVSSHGEPLTLLLIGHRLGLAAAIARAFQWPAVLLCTPSVTLCGPNHGRAAVKTSAGAFWSPPKHHHSMLGCRVGDLSFIAGRRIASSSGELVGKLRIKRANNWWVVVPRRAAY